MVFLKKLTVSLICVCLISGVFTSCQKISLGDIPEAEMVPLADSPAISTVLMPVASGTDVKKNSKVTIDISNTKDGYVMIKYAGTGSAGIKVLITGPSKVAYTYNQKSDGTWEVFPLSDGDGAYSIGVYKNVSGNQYSTEFTANINVTLKDVFAPFLLPNQYVNYTADTVAVKQAATLTTGVTTTLSKVDKIYNHVVNNFTYDKQLAATVKSGYLPNLDQIWTKKSGICFDYAAIVTAMLRSQSIPTKLVVGYTGQAYHAWISVYTAEEGWIEGAIYFDGKTWKLMDPTFASSANSSAGIMQYIGDGKNYSARFLY